MFKSVRHMTHPFTSAALIGLSLLGNAANAANCRFFENPVVQNGDCTDFFLYQSKTSATIDSGITVSDSAGSAPYGPVSPGQLPAFALVSINYGTPVIDSFVNNGTIISYQATYYQNVGNVRPPAFSVGGSTTITALTNNGTITTAPIVAVTDPAYTMEVWGTVGTFLNSGSVGTTGTSKGLLVAAGGAIGSIDNLGSISGGGMGITVDALGSIGTLSNLQSDLTYTGNLPANYNTRVNSPTSYGKLNVTAGVGTTTFGIAPGSSVTNATYTAVLNGVTGANLVATSGVYGGGLVQMNWLLTNPSGTQWDLTASSTPITPTVPGTGSGNKLSSAILFSFAPAATAFVVASGAPLSGAIQALTPSQVSALSSVHAEGYSSNMTISLEQMGHVTNTVMDRIHAPLSGQSATSAAYEIDQGRYFWVDASAMKGTVDSYDQLAGFGYQLSGIVMGGDLWRDASGGFGLFGGVGYTTMTESEQVAQDFSSINYYLGVYGGKYLSNDFKLSGAAGYVLSDTTAKRYNPNVGAFTGGTAKSDYQSNGAYAALKLSRPFMAMDRLTLTPFAGVSYTQLWMSQANEAGGNDFNYSISSANARSVLTFVGAEFLMPLSHGTKNPLALTGFYRFGYDWSADSNSAHEITANSHLFGSFTQIGANKGPVNNLMGLGLQGNIARGVSLRAGIVGRISTYGSEIGGGGEVRIEF
jgi:hypothetical protein